MQMERKPGTAKEYDVANVVGAFCMSTEDGQRLFKFLHADLQQSEPIVLDFANVKVTASPFFNAAIGALLADFQSDVLDHYLKCVHLRPTDEALLAKVKENAVSFYRNAAHAEVVKKASARLFAE